MRENRALNGRLVATKKETHYSANFMEEKEFWQEQGKKCLELQFATTILSTQKL